MTAASSGILSRSALTTVGMATQGVARLVYTVAIGRFAAEGALGDTSAVLSLAVYLSLALPAGLGIAASRYLPLPGLRNAAMNVLNRWFWGSSIVLALVAVPIAFAMTQSLAAAISSAFLVWTYNAYVYTRGALMGEDRILRATIADFVSSLLAITALVAVLVAGADWALLLPLSAGYALFALLARPRTPLATATEGQRAEIRRFVGHATVGALAAGGLLPATMIFVRAFDSPTNADLFAAALSLATPANMVAQAVNQVLIPHFARLHDTPEAMRNSQRTMLLGTTLLFACVFGVVIAITPSLLPLIYDPRFAGGAPAMQSLLIVVFFISATCAPAAYLVAAGHQRLYSRLWLVALIAGMIVMAILSPSFGMWGAITGFAVGGIGGSLAIIIAGLIVKPARVASLPATEHDSQ